MRMGGVQDMSTSERRHPHLVRVRAQRDAKGACETKIGELKVALLVNEQVLRLEVTVQDTMAVAVAHALDELRHETLDHGLAEPQRLQVRRRAIRQRLAAPAVRHRQRLHVLLEIQIQKLKHQVQLVPIGVHNVEQPHNVRVIHLLQQRDFANRRRGYALVFGLQADLLEGDDPVRVA